MNRRIQLISICMLLLTTFLLSNACMADTPYRTETFDISGLDNLVVKTSGGAITVYGGQVSKAKVEMYVKTNWGSKGERSIESRLQNYDIEIVKEGSTLKAQAKREKNGGGNGLSISFKVFVPENVSTLLHTSGGSIHIAGLIGQNELNTSGGSLKIEQVEGTTHAVTSGGSIKLEQCKGHIDAKTSGGSISVEKGSGEFLLQTSGGSISLDDLEGSVDARTSGGGISADLKKVKGAVNLRTSGGSIHLHMPPNLGLDLDLRGSRVDVELTNFTGESHKDKIVGKLNGGGIPVILATSGGGVHLDFDN